MTTLYGHTLAPREHDGLSNTTWPLVACLDVLHLNSRERVARLNLHGNHQRCHVATFHANGKHSRIVHADYSGARLATHTLARGIIRDLGMDADIIIEHTLANALQAVSTAYAAMLRGEYASA